MDRPKLLALTAAMLLANMTPEAPPPRYREDEAKAVKPKNRAKVKAARKQRRKASHFGAAFQFGTRRMLISFR